jgi:organic hydroperoxide reductase OsmC/OhrA
LAEHRASIIWTRESEAFDYTAYNRGHLWRFDSGIEVPASAASQFLGTADRVDPEEAFVASISSCHMLTFLAICAKKRIVVNHYTDNAVGFLEKNAGGKLAVTRVRLAPQITFGGTAPSLKVLRRLHRLSHQECFIANSVNTRIEIES